MASAIYQTSEAGTPPYYPAPAGIWVYRLARRVIGGAESDYWELLPHVRPVSDSWRQGAEPGSAQFLYSFDVVMATVLGSPTRYHEVWPLTATSWWSVQVDDAVQIRQVWPTGGYAILWHGLAQAPQCEFGPKTEHATFQALGWPSLEWSERLGGMVHRNMDTPWDATRDGEGEDGGVIPNDVPTDLPARFNPDGLPNMSQGQESGEEPYLHRVFADPLRAGEEPKVVAHWTLADAVRYVVRHGNPHQEYTRYDLIWPHLDETLSVVVEAVEGEPIDPENPATFTREPIRCHDLPISGMAWPEALEAILAPHGFMFTWRMLTVAGDPQWQLDIYRLDATEPTTYFRQPAPDPRGAALALSGPADASSGTLSLDTTGVHNEVWVETDTILHQFTAILAPLFDIDESDANYLNRGDYVKTSESFADNRDKYRLFGLDECAEGHYDIDAQVWRSSSLTPPDLSRVFRHRGQSDPAPGVRPYVHRRRPAQFGLVERHGDKEGAERVDARLYVLVGYDGPKPGLIDLDAFNALAPQLVTQGGWELCEDRFGIRINVEDPNSWDIGKPESGNPLGLPIASGKLNVVERLAAPTEDRPAFCFALTVAVRGDQGLRARSIRSAASPRRVRVVQRDDCRDRFAVEEISRYSDRFDEADVRVVDDSDAAEDYAQRRREHLEPAKLSGSISVDRLEYGRLISQRVIGIAGRNVPFVTTVSAVENPRYPILVGIDHTYHPEYQTTYMLDDRRAEPRYPEPAR